MLKNFGFGHEVTESISHGIQNAHEFVREDLLIFDQHKDQAACGIGLILNMDGKSDHDMVQSAVKKLGSLEYRSGYNYATGESDGAGLRFYGLDPAFFQKFVNSFFFSFEINF